MTVNLNDASVALAGFARRYNEVLAGPRDDPAWDRLVHSVPKGAAHSPLGWAAHSAALLEALAAVAHELPSTKSPVLLRSVVAEPGANVGVAEVIATIKSAGDAASAAVKARSRPDKMSAENTRASRMSAGTVLDESL